MSERGGRRNDVFSIASSANERRQIVDTCVRICSHRRVKLLLFLLLILSCVSCTTLENRRDLYRSPGEGYEKWYPEPPPTRGPATGPVRSTTTTTTTTTTTQGAIKFPDE